MITYSSLPVRVACATLDVSKSAYYQTRNKEPAVNKDEAILDQIRIIASDFSRYGYRRMTKALQRSAIAINHKRVHRIMKEHSLLVKRKRFTPITTQSNHNLPRYDNLIKEMPLFAEVSKSLQEIGTIDEQEYFVFNESKLYDSPGLVDERKIIGKPFFLVFPFSRFSRLY